MSKRVLRVFDTLDAMTVAAEDEFARRAQAAISARGRFAAVLCGGTTPRALYERIAKRELPWKRVHFFFGDERCVPPEHFESNYRMARETLLSQIDVPEENVHRMRAELDPERAAADYEAEIERFFRLAPGSFPVFDLVLLGMGADGHTASLFPGSTAIDERKRIVCSTWVERLGAHRITLTFPALDAADCVLFVVAGADKRTAMRSLLRPVPDAEELPAAAVQPSGELLWFVDRAAAGTNP